MDMKCIVLAALVYLHLCLAQECQAAKSWADVVIEKTTTTPSNTKTTPSNTKKTTTTRPAGVIYKKLPRKASLYKVRNAYDGDTLTLVDERRVRFLGIDTPELEDNQAFAQEAKEFTKRLCHKQQVYLDIHGTDKYNRVLASVWVPLDDGTFLNVNEGLVANGLASVYLASRNDKRLPNLHHLLKLQNQARESRRGIWKNFVERNVVVTRYGSAYHLPTCRHLARSHNTRIIKASEAVDQGLHACRTCLPDEVRNLR